MKRKSEIPAEDNGLVKEIAKNFMPGLEKIIKRMEEVSPEFRVRIEETDQDLNHRMERKWSCTPKISTGYRLDTVRGRRKLDELRIIPEPDPIFEILKEEDYIYVTAQIPNEKECNIKTELDCNVLKLSSGDFRRTMDLSETPGPIVEQSYKNGVLHLKIKR
ncbi:Hsp20/alpha crystallin family protein [Methanosarcina sp. Mfa9]|uniref:Hsp20/alpha crystallin family protein n=1 Tax=Methanosarcina sp. Mfa9 TaxID=3439063 RepID=UPI003F82A2FE